MGRFLGPAEKWRGEAAVPRRPHPLFGAGPQCLKKARPRATRGGRLQAGFSVVAVAGRSVSWGRAESQLGRAGRGPGGLSSHSGLPAPTQRGTRCSRGLQTASSRHPVLPPAPTRDKPPPWSLATSHPNSRTARRTKLTAQNTESGGGHQAHEKLTSEFFLLDNLEVRCKALTALLK